MSASEGSGRVSGRPDGARAPVASGKRSRARCYVCGKRRRVAAWKVVGGVVGGLLFALCQEHREFEPREGVDYDVVDEW